MRPRATPSTRAPPLRTRPRSSFGTRSAGLRATAPASLHLELRERAGVVPLRGEDSLVLVVPRETADSGLDELEAALVREVLGVRLHVALEVDGPPHEGAEVLREFPREPLSGEDLRDGLAGREPDVRDRVQVPESGADRRLRVALPVELHDDLRDLVRLERDPLRVFRDERAGRAVLALPSLLPPPWNAFGFITAVGGGASLVYCASFLSRHGRGTPYPRLPPKRLVTTGPFGRVRNPVISSWGVMMIGFALAMGWTGLLLLMIPGFLGIHVYVRYHEEPILQSRFGVEYEEYRSRVPRWIPRLRL